jgi:hypothetical protein
MADEDVQSYLQSQGIPVGGVVPGAAPFEAPQLAATNAGAFDTEGFMNWFGGLPQDHQSAITTALGVGQGSGAMPAAVGGPSVASPAAVAAPVAAAPAAAAVPGTAQAAGVVTPATSAPTLTPDQQAYLASLQSGSPVLTNGFPISTASAGVGM